MQTFAEQLSALRKERRITQEQLAQELNVSRTTISRWESGKVMPDIDTIKRLSQVLNYNFFTLEALTVAPPQGAPAAQEAPAAQGAPAAPGAPPGQDVPTAEEAQENPPVSKSRRGWIIGVCGMLLVLCLALVIGAVIKPVRPAEKTVQTASIVCTPSGEEVYLEPFDDSGYGWYASFAFENQSDVPFTPEGAEIIFYEGTEISMRVAMPYEELKPCLTDGKLVKGAAPLVIPLKANLLTLTHVTCRVYGVDDNKYGAEATGTVKFICEFANLLSARDAALQAAVAKPGTAQIVGAPSVETAYLEPFEDSYGWNVTFFFQNYGDTAFKPDGLEVFFCENDTVCMKIDVPYADIQNHMSNGKLYKGGIPLQMPIGANQLNFTHCICRIFGTDDNGNPVDVSTTVQYSQDYLRPAK